MRFYHASTSVLAVGDTLHPAATSPVSGTKQPLGEEWRTERVWMAADPGNAGCWIGHDYHSPVYVYEVTPVGVPVEHTMTEWDEEVWCDWAQDQWHAPRAVIARVLHVTEWNDLYVGPAGPPENLNVGAGYEWLLG